MNCNWLVQSGVNFYRVILMPVLPHLFKETYSQYRSSEEYETSTLSPAKYSFYSALSDAG